MHIEKKKKKVDVHSRVLTQQHRNRTHPNAKNL